MNGLDTPTRSQYLRLLYCINIMVEFNTFQGDDLSMRESELRDMIAKNIEVIEKGLVLLEKEKFIPHSIGTRSFIDLYVRDKNNKHVIIELKRSNSSSREAIHEVFKYVEGLKGYLGVRDDEIRVIIASTDWEELFIPFSRFVADSKLNVKGLKINIDENSLTIQEIESCPIHEGRVILPWHEVFLYASQENLELGIKSIEECCKQKQIHNYIIVAMRLDQVKSPFCNYVAYFAIQTLQEEEYWKILLQDIESYKEAQELVDGMTDDSDKDERLQTLYELVAAMKPRPYCDLKEIGYPAKFSKIVTDLCVEILAVKRYGIFEKTPY